MLKNISYLLILYINIISPRINDINEKAKNHNLLELYRWKK